jgi:hypothetical protein
LNFAILATEEEIVVFGKMNLCAEVDARRSVPDVWPVLNAKMLFTNERLIAGGMPVSSSG